MTSTLCKIYRGTCIVSEYCRRNWVIDFVNCEKSARALALSFQGDVMLKVLCASFFLFSYVQASTIIPFERDISRLPEYHFIMSKNDISNFFTSLFVGDENENLYSHGFSFQNHGPNEIVTTSMTGFDYAYRDFSFITEDKSKRDTYLWVSDYAGTGSVSDFFESIIVFLPRENQMHIEETDSDLLVTLTTGEELLFSKKHKTIKSGVIKEGPLDYNPSRSARKHAQLTYSGKGLMIRVDSRGSDPRLGTTAQIVKEELPVCKIPSKTFWTQDGFPKFRFVSDEDAFAVISEHCGSSYLP